MQPPEPVDRNTSARFTDLDQIDHSPRILGALWGALVGDALGVPVEFQSRDAVKGNPVTDMRGFGTHRQPPGTWSDDSSLLLCTTDSLAVCGEFNATDLGGRFVRWEREGYWTPHGNVFDIGATTAQALSRLGLGTPPEECGGTSVESNGNGSLMRISPIALWFGHLSADCLATFAHRASTLTHRHARSQMACALYCLFARALVYGRPPRDAFRDTWREFTRLHGQSPFASERRHFQHLESERLGSLPEHQISSGGYVVDTLTASIWCLLTSSSFEETVLKAVNLGGDTDTTASVAGGLAGALYSKAAIPSAWIGALAKQKEIEALFAQFVARHGEFAQRATPPNATSLHEGTNPNH